MPREFRILFCLYGGFRNRTAQAGIELFSGVSATPLLYTRASGIVAPAALSVQNA